MFKTISKSTINDDGIECRGMIGKERVKIVGDDFDAWNHAVRRARITIDRSYNLRTRDAWDDSRSSREFVHRAHNC